MYNVDVRRLQTLTLVIRRYSSCSAKRRPVIKTQMQYSYLSCFDHVHDQTRTVA